MRMTILLSAIGGSPVPLVSAPDSVPVLDSAPVLAGAEMPVVPPGWGCVAAPDDELDPAAVAASVEQPKTAPIITGANPIATLRRVVQIKVKRSGGDAKAQPPLSLRCERRQVTRSAAHPATAAGRRPT